MTARSPRSPRHLRRAGGGAGCRSCCAPRDRLGRHFLAGRRVDQVSQLVAHCSSPCSLSWRARSAKASRETVARRLRQRLVDQRHLAHRGIQLGIGARLIGAEQPDVARVLEAGDHRFELGHQPALFVAPGFAGQARDRGERVDGRIAPLLGDRPVEHDVAVEDAARAIRDRVVVVVAVDQHREDRGDGAGAVGARDRHARAASADR